MLSNLRVITVVSVYLLLPAFGWSSTALAQSWYNADTHLHAQCLSIDYSAAELLGFMKQEGINIGSVLIFGGPSLPVDPVHFRGQEDDPVSEPNYIVHWDIEIAQLPGDWHGHMNLLNVAQKDAVVVNQVNYPGQDYLLPNYEYVQSQGGIVGYGHGHGWRGGSYRALARSGGPRELPLDVALARVDFLASEIMNADLYWLWYSMLNAGFHFPLLGVSDLECYWPIVGKYHAAFPLPTGDTLTYTKFIDAVREGRTVIRRNNTPPDFLDIRVNGTGLGGELILPNRATTVNVQVDASSVISGQRVELILDGNVIGSQDLTNSLQTYQWSVPLTKSGWIAAKTTGNESYPSAPGYSARPNSDGAHTAATFVLLGGCPIRNDPLAARNWKGYLDEYYELGVSLDEFGASAAEVRQKVDEAKLVWERIAQEGEGSIAMDCQGFTINAGLNDAWFNPETDGQGFFITVFPELGFVTMAWFTYDTVLPPDDATANLDSPGHRWLTAAGSYADNQAIMNIVITSDGLFDTATDVQRTDPPGSDGTLILTFDSCNSGTVEYDIPSISMKGIIPIQRVAKDNITLCQALSAD